MWVWLVTAAAAAPEVGFTVDAGLLGPMWQHREDFRPGATLTGRPRLSVTRWLDLEASVGLLASLALVRPGVAAVGGLGVRVHGAPSDAVPWIGGAGLVHHGGVDRIGFEVSAGLSLGRVGPMVRFVRIAEPAIPDLLVVGLERRG